MAEGVHGRSFDVADIDGAGVQPKRPDAATLRRTNV
jgi:hypothetical protein